MTSTTKPAKERVRDYIDRRTHEKTPPPTPEEVRRELGWALVPENESERSKKRDA